MTGDTRATSIQAAETMRGRRFGVYDSMVLIAGIALLFAPENNKVRDLIDQLVGLCKAVAVYYGFVPAGAWGPPRYLAKAIRSFLSGAEWYGVQAAEMLILNMTAVFLLMRVRRPRPPVRTLLRQPGTVAGLAVPVGLVLVVGWMHFLFFGGLVEPMEVPIAVGGTVALAWTCLALVRGWEAEPSWVDRMGRLIGAAAIAVGLTAFLRFGLFL